MAIESQLVDNISGKLRRLRVLFDTGAYMTVMDSGALLRAGYNINKGTNAEFNVVGRKRVPAKEVLLQGLELGGRHDMRISLGPVLVYSTDMSETNTSAVLGLNVIREFDTRIMFGSPTVIELTPKFDICNLVRFEDFSRMESRFGLWSQSHVERTFNGG